MKNIKKALQNGEIVFGAIISSSSPISVEIAGYMGFDYVFIDCEHAPASPYGKEVEELIRAANAADVTSFVRVINSTDFGQIRKVLDLGAKGIIAPLVSTKEDAQAITNACFFPPEGKRGSSSSSRAAKFGARDWFDFVREANEDLTIIALIENVQGLNNLDEICSVKGITVIQYGYIDLGMDMGIVKLEPGKEGSSVAAEMRKHPTIQSHMDNVIRTATKHGKYAAFIAANGAESADLVKRGFQVIVSRPDVQFLSTGFRNFLDESKVKIKELNLSLKR